MYINDKRLLLCIFLFFVAAERIVYPSRTFWKELQSFGDMKITS